MLRATSLCSLDAYIIAFVALVAWPEHIGSISEAELLFAWISAKSPSTEDINLGAFPRSATKSHLETLDEIINLSALRKAQNVCTYFNVSPQERVAKLEALVRRLGGDPEDDPDSLQLRQTSLPRRTEAPPYSPERLSTAADIRNDSTLVREDGESVYAESRAWLGWNGKTSFGERPQRGSQIPKSGREKRPEAFSFVMPAESTFGLVDRLPNADTASKLWYFYFRNVDPLLKISFKSDLEQLQAVNIQSASTLSDPELAFVSSLYFITVASLSDGECMEAMGQSRHSLLQEYRMLSEQALVCSGVLGASNLIIVEALALYIAAGANCLSPKRLWGLMGIAMRNAERLGLHRDGTFLGLSPYETERRRRVWWQLQQLDIGLAIWAATSSLTLHADWDVKLPLNIEDNEIKPDAQCFPKEREGITGISDCLWRYWFIQEQRTFRLEDGRPVGLAWLSDKGLTQQQKETRIDKLETGLKAKFLQHCDPVRPLDQLIQLSSRSLVCTFRGLILHPLAYNGNDGHRQKLIDLSVQFMEYVNTAKTSASLKRFKLRTDTFFAWPQFAHLLHEVTHFNFSHDTNRIWELLVATYSSHPELLDLFEDARKMQAAELMVSAYKTRENVGGIMSSSPKPTPVIELESRLQEAKQYGYQNTLSKPSTSKISSSQSVEISSVPETMEGNASPLGRDAMDIAADLNYDDIDWGFWLGFGVED